jgi:hypothetical protein
VPDQNTKPGVKRELAIPPGVKRFATVDLETDPFKYGEFPEPFAAAFHLPATDDSPGECQAWWGRDCIQKLVTRCKKFKGLIYAHNGGKFDFHYLLAHLPLSQSDTLCIGSRITSMRFGAGYEFRDSFSLIPVPLSAWGKINIDINKLRRDRREKNKTEILDYLKGDVRHLHEMLSAFFAKYPQKLTLASTTFHILQKQFGHKIPRMNFGDDARFRRHYFAGRVEFFALGEQKGPFHIMDINSAFPWAMTKPQWFSDTYKTVQTPKRSTLVPQGLYIASCTAGGALAHRAQDKAISFPVEERLKYFTTGWELLSGLKLRAIKDLNIHWGFIPKKLESFEDFVNYFYEMKARAKAEGNVADELHAKLFLNSAYGKTAINLEAMKDVVFRTYGDSPKGKGWEEAWSDEKRSLAVYKRSARLSAKGSIMKPYCVPLGAGITGCVRAFLFASMRQCRDVLYCDTDSIIARDVSKLKSGAALGQWKHEMTCDVVWIGGKKLYVAHNAEYPWKRTLPKAAKKKDWVFIDGWGWNQKPTKTIKSFKTAAKGVRLSIRALVAVCSGKTRKGKFDAPSYSALAPSHFTTRTIKRADKRTQ